MKFTLAIPALLAALTTTCLAQTVNIGFPANGTFVSPDSNLVVQVIQRVTSPWTPTTALGVVIGLFSCTTTNSVCLPPGQALGTILFNGPFNPQFPPRPSTGPLQQNFTVTIPSRFARGPAQLSVFHTALVGQDNGTLAETVDVILNVQVVD